MTVTLVASRSPSPFLNIPLENQVPTFGAFSGPSSILTYPSTPFSITFLKDTFTDPAARVLNYYAAMADNTPLPAWMSFNPGTLAFAGTTPPFESLVQPPQTFAFQLIASDVVGFSAAYLAFSIIVGNHEISSDRALIALNATVGSPLSYEGLQTSVKLDGEPATPKTINITSTPNLPSWLFINRATWDIYGTPTASALSTNFTLVLQDSFLDTLNITISIIIDGDLFNGSLPEVNVTTGSHFDLDLKPYLLSPSQTNLAIDTDPQLDWIRLDSDNETISGDVPLSFSESVIDVTVLAKSKDSEVRSTATLMLNVLLPNKSPSQTSAPAAVPPSTGVVQPTHTGQSGSQEGSKGNPLNSILLAVLLPLLVLCLSLSLILFCIYRRHKYQQSRPIQHREISAPIPGTFVYNVGEDADSSVHDAHQQYDIRRTASASLYLGRKSYIPTVTGSIRKSRTENLPSIASNLRPPFTKGKAAHGSTLGDSRSAWLLAAVVGTFRPGQQTRRSRSRSYLSDTSLYGDSNDVAAGQDPLNVLGGDDRSWQSVIDVSIPSLEGLSSVQQTPEMAYYGKRETEPDEVDLSLVLEQHHSSIAEPRELPPRPQSRLGTYANVSGKALQGLSVQTNTESLGKDVLAQNTHIGHSGGKRFAHNKPQRSRRDSYAHVIRVPLARPDYVYHKLGAARPVSRGGADSNDRFDSNISRLDHGTDGHGPTSGIPPCRGAANIDALLAEKTTSTAKRGGQDSQQTHGRDSLGISYEDLVNGSPFHPSKSWVTIGDEAAGTMKTCSSEDTETNWTVLEESPVSRDWRGGSEALPVPPKSRLRASAGPVDLGGIGWALSRYSKERTEGVDSEKENETARNGKRLADREGSLDSIGEEDDFSVYI